MKFTKDLRSTCPLELSATQRFIPLVQNQCGNRRPNFEATLEGFATLIIIKRSSDYNLLQGSFAIPPTIALAKVLSCWGLRFAWIAQREFAANVIRGMKAYKVVAAFLCTAVVSGDPTYLLLTLK